MVTSTNKQRLNSSGLRRDLEVLEALSTPEALANQGLGVTRVSEMTGRDKGQISRTLATLAEAGFVQRERNGSKYQLGFQLYALASRTAEARLVQESGRFLRKVVNLTHETTHLVVLRGGNALTLKSEMSNHAFRGVGWEGVSVAALRTSSGRALISDWSNEELAEWYAEHSKDSLIIQPVIGSPLANGLPPASQSQTRSKINSLEDLYREAEVIRNQGYATVDEEFELGLVGASAPIRDDSNRIIGAINVSAPKTRIGQHLDQVGEIVARIALEFSLYLGSSKIRA
ncbi:IclR family transcriptional regulator [Candidatus Rhodoluna planktonica]|uniref:IclR family transcriptional regulator n=1 Tax=Candidatus Rhodoluna planktonica TaxID=535712 RepID=A0A1D9DXH0_9MICO|nr:IclR family transcriptional regulator [Candidatus Rhodoluna planktonica]AOY55508.1 IclR family transcriptional regulator [Candidatus Rhodoluna planktonica]